MFDKHKGGSGKGKSKAKAKPKAKAARRKLGPPQAVSNTMKPHPRADPKESSTAKFIRETDQFFKAQDARGKLSDATNLKDMKKAASKVQSEYRKVLSGPTAESKPESRKLSTLSRARSAVHAGRMKRYITGRPQVTSTKKKKK